PEGIHIPAQLNNAFITINGSTELFKPFNPFNTRLRNYYSISGRKITFVLKNRNLPGTRTQKDIRKRTGTIRFTLKTNETGNIGPCLYSTASITFVNLDGSRNRAINAHDLVRTNCANTDPCPLAEKEGGPDNR
ncbi:MAG TPA: hypothetical protein PKG89_13615, partial [Ferruginibacter sp.]|nr:hypothetical protein [Ferruginibacter sp.]